MKNLISIMIVALVMLFGCAKDTVTDQNQNPSLKRANVPIPAKGSFCMTPDLTVPPVQVTGTPLIVNGEVKIPKIMVAGRFYTSGHRAHGGELIMEQSFSETQSATLLMSYLPQQVVFQTVNKVQTAGDNGISFGTSTSTINVTDPTHITTTGEWIITGGTGIWENATGSGTSKGVSPCFENEGTIIYKR